MDKHTLRVLEFHKVLQMAAFFAVTVPGRDIVHNTVPLSNIGEIRNKIELVSECLRLIAEGRVPGIEHFDDLSPLMRKVRPANSLLDPTELRSFLPLFSSSLSLRKLSEDSSCPGLGSIASELITHPHISRAIEAAIDREWRIRDNASSELLSIRNGIRSCEKRIKKVLDGMLKREDLEPYIQEFYLAERNKRWVIPVKRDFRGHIPGVVHDISNTGVTVYVEPYSIQQLGNELESLRSEEKLEEYRILKGLTSLVQEHLPDIEQDYRIVAGVDALQSMAEFSKHMDMSPPALNEKGYVKIISGRHPLLYRALQKESHEANPVPLDIDVGRDYSCMVITGSNAGGKTVALKTIGVLTLMALSGMHIPAESGSEIAFLKNILVDIGDEQSIEENLSTFSAHITRISEIIRQSREHSMVIIDELGTGTDPEQGGALSCAILRRLHRQGALTLVSTHIGMLKAFAHSEPGMVNAAMEMEEVNINGVARYRPTYRLVVGEPGTSHTYEIAELLGLDAGVISEARDFTGGGAGRIDLLLSGLSEKKRKLDDMLKETERLKRECEHDRIKLKEDIQSVETRRKEKLTEALSEAEEIVRKAKREAWEIIDNLKRSSLKDAKEAVKELDRKIEGIAGTRKKLSPGMIHRLKRVREGERVFVTTLGKNGVVHSVIGKRNRCKVTVGEKRIEVAISDLAEPVHDVEEGTRRVPHKDPGITVEHIPGEIKVVGYRVDPALSLIERYLNDAALAGLHEVRIIHGIGAGILAAAIREYLGDYPLVRSFREGSGEEGGAAVTMVVL
jgi:DNA mismatch repair protein MutS2